jgi:serine phosphatase RsbU (regulator of sigma subunit)/anti-sigma regulatory factor (Ser/Thr protein kinase)
MEITQNRIWAKVRAFKQTIAAKIFGLALFLLLPTIGLAGFLLWEVVRTEQDLKIVAHLDVPLTESISRINEFGLRRRLAFERWFGALNATAPNQEIISESKTNYDSFTVKLTNEFATARGMIASYPGGMASRPLLVEVRTLLDQIEPAYPVISARQREVLDLQRSGQHEKANALLNLLNDIQRTVQTQRELLQNKMAELSATSDQAVELRQRYVLWLTIAATVSTVLLGLVVAALITDRLTQPVRSLASAMRDVQKGNLNVQLPVRSTDEVGALTDSFNFFVQELRAKEQMKQTFGKIESELKIAHEIQMSMVPKIFPPFPERSEFDIFATLVPAKEVGGDLYDFFFLDDDHLCFAVGDVSDKGVPASLFMAVTKTLFRATARTGSTPGEILARLNAEISRDNESCMFVTFFCGILDIRTGQIDYSNGGHNLPYYLRHDGVSPLKNAGGGALGLVEQTLYASGRMVLGPGEALLLYTDGVTEAMDPSDTLYSDQRLAQFLARNRDSAPRQIIGDLVSDVRHFAGAAPQSDDITVLALLYFGTTEKMREELETKLHNKLAELRRFNQTLMEFGQHHGLASTVVHDLNLALEEILTNIISYGYTDGQEHEIRVRLSVRPGEVKAEVEDDGQSFNPLAAPEPHTAKALEERTIGGLGIHLVRTLMDGLEYKRQADRNILTIRKKT